MRVTTLVNPHSKDPGKREIDLDLNRVTSPRQLELRYPGKALEVKVGPLSYVVVGEKLNLVLEHALKNEDVATL